MFGLFNAARDANNPDPITGLMSPEAIKERRAMARALAQRGSDTSPVQHWSQGAARLVDALSGALDDFSATRAEQTGMASAREAEKGLFGMLTGGGSETPAATPMAGASTGGGSAPAPAPLAQDKEQVARTVYDRLVEGGLSPMAASGLVGNIKMESSFNTGARNPGDGRDGSDSIGLVQWNSGRAQALKQLAAQTGRDWRDPAVQADHIIAELNGPERRARDLIMSARTPEEAGRNAIAFFRPAGFTWQNPAGGHNAAARIAAAQMFAGRFGGQPTAPMPMVTTGNAAQMPLAREQAATAPMPTIQPVQGDDPVQLRADAEFYRQSNPEAARQFMERAKAAEAARGVQTAQAGTADAPATAGQPAQGFNPPQPQRPVAPAAPAPQRSANEGARLRAAMGILNDPWASPAAKAIAQAVLSQERRDPRDAVIKDLTIEEKRRGLSRQPFTDVTRPDGSVVRIFENGEQRQLLGPQGKAEERTSYMKELEDENKARAARGEPPLTIMQYRTQIGRANAPSVSIDQRQEGEFAKQTGAALAKRFDALATDGDDAAQSVPLLGELRRLGGRIDTGAAASVKAFLGRVGFKTEGISDIEAFKTLINRLTPQQRLPGSGATSDFDAKMFQESLPQLMNTPQGNTLILDTMEALAQNRMARGEIAMRVQIGELTPKEAMGEIRKLQAEARAFSDRVRDFTKPGNRNQAGAPAPLAPNTTSAPVPGQAGNGTPGVRRFNPATGRIE